MEFFSLAILTLIGVLLILAEIIFIPGTTIAGVAGAIMVGVGVYLCYENLGSYYGHINVGISLSTTVVLLFLSFKFKWWNLMAMNKQLDGKFDRVQGALLQVGDKGKTTSALRPMGNAEFKDKIVEVTTEGGFMDANTAIVITKITGDKIIVTPNTKV